MSEKNDDNGIPNKYLEETRIAVFKKMDAFKQRLHSRNEEHFIPMGRLFHCHLMLEKLILDYIKKRNPNIGPIEEVVWSFEGKLRIATRMDNSIFGGAWNAPIKAINKMRNSFGHNLDVVEIREEEAKPVRDFLSFWPQTATLSAIDLI